MSKLTGRLVGFIAFGGVFVCAVAAVLAVSTGLIDVRQAFPGLPEPPQVDIGELPRFEGELPRFEGELPQFEGELPAIPSGIPGVELPGSSGSGEQVSLAGQVARRPLVASIPAPQQLSSDPRVIGTNLFLAILMAVIFGITSTMLGNMLRDEEPRIRAWLRKLGLEDAIAAVGRIFGWSPARAAARRGCLTLPLIALILVLYGVIFASLEEGTRLLSREGATLAVTMAFTVGLVSFGGDIARRIGGQLWRSRTHFHLYPANLGVAVLTVALSRFLHLSPGIAFGTPGGADVDMPEDKREQREAALSLIQIAVLAVLGGVGWGASAIVLAALGVPVAERVAGVLAYLLTAAENTGLVLFFVALQTLFFEMLPLAYSAGRAVFRWSKVVWVGLFIPLTFLFNHALVNPRSGFLDSFTTSNVRFLWAVLFVLVGITGGLWFYFNFIDDVLQEWAGIKPAPRR